MPRTSKVLISKNKKRKKEKNPESKNLIGKRTCIAKVKISHSQSWCVKFKRRKVVRVATDLQ